MPRSFLIRKFHPKMDQDQDEKSMDDDGCTETGKDSITEYLRDDQTQVFLKESNSPQIGLIKSYSTELSSIGATTEVDTAKKSTFQCKNCSRSFNRASDLKRHQLAHIDSKPYKCQVCDRQFTWLGNFQKHFASHSEPAPRFSFFTETQLGVFRTYPSSIFYEVTPYENVPVYHKNIPGPTFPIEYNQVHVAQRALTCNICFLTFTTSRALKMHTRIHTGEKPYKCSQCSKAFARKDELHTHKYFHTGEKPFKCDKCSASFVRFGHLQRHRFVHYDVKPYQCKLCPKSFTQYRNLQTHMYKHTGERPFRCKYCPKGFTQYGTLQAHERTHTGERPFMCEKCEKRFITSSHLRWHVRTQHS